MISPKQSNLQRVSESRTIEVGATADAQLVLEGIRTLGGVIAVLCSTDGGFYRAPGALMGFCQDGTVIGDLSSGCIEADLALHAASCWATGRPLTLRYGKGSPFFDIVLPCGGSIDVQLSPIPDANLLDQTLTDMAARKSAALSLPGLPHLVFRPDPRVIVVGSTPEALQLHRIACAGGYDVTLDANPDLSRIDQRTAIVLMHHDHDKAIAQLRDALYTPAYWIGALGSHSTQSRRLAALRGLGVSRAELDRVRGPIGLIASGRDPRTLAVSVLADIVQAAR
ncbi:XdhC family protein [Roseicitreum antarcticum]|uniref:Xanthine dehydrogenase accessory factor n=1 Tax=Roseicitreum antarcticum TaxID=564137 RepID=A0A1H2ZQC4_9RHOB|nr:XdhC family protein [Roseicitreum antarcticum]SDX18939.1 xanthine dehydrogenase accessory factor [Roseicitreum antarcticum]